MFGTSPEFSATDWEESLRLQYLPSVSSCSLFLFYQSIGICEKAFGRKHPDTGKLALRVGEGKGILQLVVIMVLTHFGVRIMLIGLHTTTNWSFFEDSSGSLAIGLTVSLLYAFGNFQKTWVLAHRTDLEGHENKR